MDDGSDFTFSQAGPPVSGDGFDHPAIVNLEKGINGTLLEGINGMGAEDISGISIIKDELLNGRGSKQNGGFSWKGPPLPKNACLRKEETVGSLSFNVIESSPRPPKESAGPSASERGSSLAEIPLEPKKAVRKPVPRAKVPFEKGYSQMDWLKLTRTHPDLAGLKGQSNRRLVSTNEVKQHQTEEAMWTVLKGRVYNLSPYMKFHPGGVDMLRKAVGKDCTTLFNKYHAWVNAEFLLEKCLVGILDDSH